MHEEKAFEAVFDLIERIAATNSKNEKQALIVANSENALFLEVLKAALNPFITYGIAKLPERPETDKKAAADWETLIKPVLDMLAARKLSGNAARYQVEKLISAFTVKEAELFGRILLKDLRAGFSESTVNKAIPGLIPTFDCMLAHPYSEHKHKLKFPLAVEPKLDGVRVLTFVTGDSTENVKFFSRSGKEFTAFDHLKEPVLIMVKAWRDANPHTEFDDYQRGVVLDSEVVSGSFNKTVSEVRKKDVQATDAKLCAFDVLPIVTFEQNEKGGCAYAGTLRHRRRLLEDIFKHKREGDPLVLLPVQMCDTEEEIHALYEKFRDRGLEGVIVKNPGGLYCRRRNHAWTKIKAEESVDVRIVGAVEGTGKYAGMLGALIVDFKGVQVNVGTGLDDAMRTSFWAAYLNDVESAEGSRSLLGRLIEVQYHEVTPDGSLRHPRFVRFRDDKDTGETA